MGVENNNEKVDSDGKAGGYGAKYSRLDFVAGRRLERSFREGKNEQT